MKKTLLAGLMLATLSAMTPASAITIASPADTLDNGVTLVSGGCGPAGFRAQNGYCYPRRPPPPRYFRRPCPPGYHPTPYGCRPNY